MEVKEEEKIEGKTPLFIFIWFLIIRRTSRKEVSNKRQVVASFCTPLSYFLEDDVKKWTVENVGKWAKIQRGIEEEDLLILRKQRVNGSALLLLTKDDLLHHPYNIPGGPAAILAEAIQKLKGKTVLRF